MVPLDDSVQEQLEVFKQYGVNKPFVTLDEAANTLGLHLNTLRKAVDDGRLSVRRFSANTVRVPVAELAKFAVQDWEDVSEVMSTAESDEYQFLLPGRINFAISHRSDGQTSFQIQREEGDTEKTWQEVNPVNPIDLTTLPAGAAAIDIFNQQPEQWVLSGISVALKPVVSSEKFTAQEDSSYEHCVNYLRSSTLRWEPRSGSPTIWPTEKFMPDVLEPSLRQGGYTLVPYFERTPLVPKNSGTFMSSSEAQSLWLYPNARAAATRCQGDSPRNNTRARLTLIPKEAQESSSRKSKTKISHFVWYGAIILDWMLAGW